MTKRIRITLTVILVSFTVATWKLFANVFEYLLFIFDLPVEAWIRAGQIIRSSKS